jgi:glutathione S-transferase
MFKLFYYPSNASMAPHMLLEEIGCAYELVLVDRDNGAHKSAEYLKLNPTGLIPVLVDGEQPIHQTAAICLHLTDKHPEAKMAPAVGDPLRPVCYQWLMYLTNTLQSELITYFYPDRMADDAAMTERVKAHAERRVGGMLDLLDAHLAKSGPFMLGAQYSVVDIYLLMLCRWTRMQARPAHTRSHLKALIDAVIARPAIQRAFAQEKLPLPWC